MILPIAYNDTYNLNHEDDIDLFPMSNDILGVTPTTITSIDASSITTGTIAITGSGSKLTFTPNYEQAEGETLTYTITDNQSNTSTATITLNVVADIPIITAYFTPSTGVWGWLEYINATNDYVVEDIYDDECRAITYKEIIYNSGLIPCTP
jgi:hypothetical protein